MSKRVGKVLQLAKKLTRQESSTKLQLEEKEIKSETHLASECPLRPWAEGTQVAGEAGGWEAGAAAWQRDLEGLEKGAGRKLLQLKVQHKGQVLQLAILRRSKKLLQQ